MKATPQLLFVLSPALMLTSFAVSTFAIEAGSLDEHLETFRSS